MYNDSSKYISGNNYTLENEKTFKYNSRRFDVSGKYIGDSFTSKPTYHNDTIHQIHTNVDIDNDPNINSRDIRQSSKLYTKRKSYNNNSVAASRNRINNINRQKKKTLTSSEYQKIKRDEIIFHKFDNMSVSTVKKIKPVSVSNRLYGV